MNLSYIENNFSYFFFVYMFKYRGEVCGVVDIYFKEYFIDK